MFPIYPGNMFAKHDEQVKLICILTFNIGIKHGFSCINVCQVPRELLKTSAFGLGFQHLPRDMANGLGFQHLLWDLANVNALENNVDRCYCINSTTMLKSNKKWPCTILHLIATTLPIPTRTIHFYKNSRFRPWSSVVIFQPLAEFHKFKSFS